MKIETESSSLETHDDGNKLIAAFDSPWGDFFVLSKGECDYIQVLRSGDFYLIEFKQGNPLLHFTSSGNLTRTEVLMALNFFHKNDVTFKSCIKWSVIKKNPWWKFWE